MFLIVSGKKGGEIREIDRMTHVACPPSASSACSNGRLAQSLKRALSDSPFSRVMSVPSSGPEWHAAKTLSKRIGLQGGASPAGFMAYLFGVEAGYSPDLSFLITACA